MNNSFTETCIGSEGGLYLRLIDCCITQPYSNTEVTNEEGRREKGGRGGRKHFAHFRESGHGQGARV